MTVVYTQSLDHTSEGFRAFYEGYAWDKDSSFPQYCSPGFAVVLSALFSAPGRHDVALINRTSLALSTLAPTANVVAPTACGNLRVETENSQLLFVASNLPSSSLPLWKWSVDKDTCALGEAASCLFGKQYSDGISIKQKRAQLIMSVLPDREVLSSSPRAALSCAALSWNKDIYFHVLHCYANELDNSPDSVQVSAIKAELKLHLGAFVSYGDDFMLPCLKAALQLLWQCAGCAMRDCIEPTFKSGSLPRLTPLAAVSPFEMAIRIARTATLKKIQFLHRAFQYEVDDYTVYCGLTADLSSSKDLQFLLKDIFDVGPAQLASLCSTVDQAVNLIEGQHPYMPRQNYLSKLSRSTYTIGQDLLEFPRRIVGAAFAIRPQHFTLPFHLFRFLVTQKDRAIAAAIVDSHQNLQQDIDEAPEDILVLLWRVYLTCEELSVWRYLFVEKRIRLRPLTAPPERSCSVEEWAAPWIVNLLHNAKLHQVLEKLQEMPISEMFDWQNAIAAANNLLISLVESPKQVELLHRVSGGKINWAASGVSAARKALREPDQPLAHVVLSNLLRHGVHDDGGNIVAVLDKMHEQGADLRAMDSEGNSLLHIAWEHKKQKLFVFLVDECGCDPKVPNAKGVSVIDLEKDKATKLYEEFHPSGVKPGEKKKHKKGKK